MLDKKWDSRLAELQAIGLTLNQAKVYLALLSTGPSPASGIANVSGVPRNKIYQTTEELSNLGLVNVVMEDPLVFEPTPFNDFIEEEAKKLRDRAGDLEKYAPSIQALYRSRNRAHPPGTYRLVRGRPLVNMEAGRLLASRRKRLHLTENAAKRLAARSPSLRPNAPQGDPLIIWTPDALLFVNARPDDDDPSQGDDTGFWSNDPALIKWVGDVLRKKGKP